MYIQYRSDWIHIFATTQLYDSMPFYFTHINAYICVRKINGFIKLKAFMKKSTCVYTRNVFCYWMYCNLHMHTYIYNLLRHTLALSSDLSVHAYAHWNCKPSICICNTSLLLLIITLNNSNYNQEEEGLVPSTYIFIHTTKVEVSNNIT